MIFARILMFLTGIGALGSCIYAFIKRKKIIDNGVVADATITSVKEGTSINGGRVWHAVINFEVDGKTTTALWGAAMRKSTYKTGKTVRIVYDKDNPTQITIPNHWMFYLALIIVSVLSLIFTFVSIFG